MSYSKRSRYSRSPSPYKRYGRSLSRSLSRSRSRSRESADVENPGNNLYVTGLSTRVTKRELEKHFSSEGTVVDVHLVNDPWTRESRGFGFVTMSNVEEADRCIKYLDRSVLEGRVITVEKARRRRGRTPTPGRYLGLRTVRVRRRSPSYSPYHRSSRYSSERERSRSRSYSPYYRRRRSFSRSHLPYNRSPVGRRNRSYSPYEDSYYSPDDGYGRRQHCRSISPSLSPRERRRRPRGYSPSVSPRARRSYSRSISPMPRRTSRRSYSRSISPRPRRSRRSPSRDLYSRSSSSQSASSRSVSRSLSPRSSSQ